MLNDCYEPQVEKIVFLTYQVTLFKFTKQKLETILFFLCLEHLILTLMIIIIITM